MIDKKDAEHTSGRAEVLAAFDDLRAAIARLAEVAQTRSAPRPVHPLRLSASEQDKERVPIVPDCADLVPRAADNVMNASLARPKPDDAAGRFAIIANDRAANSLAERVLEIQQRAGGFLK